MSEAPEIASWDDFFRLKPIEITSAENITEDEHNENVLRKVDAMLVEEHGESHGFEIRVGGARKSNPRIKDDASEPSLRD